MSKHTELPWKIAQHCSTLIEGQSGRNVGSVGGVQSNTEITLYENEANAAYIVKAANLFPELVETLDSLIMMLEFENHAPRPIFNAVKKLLLRANKTI